MFWVFIFNFQRRIRGLGNFYLEFLWFYKYSKVSIKTQIYISLKKFSNSTVFFIWLPTKYIIYYIYEFISKRTICCFSRLSLDRIKIKTDSKERIFLSKFIAWSTLFSTDYLKVKSDSNWGLYYNTIQRQYVVYSKPKSNQMRPSKF